MALAGARPVRETPATTIRLPERKSAMCCGMGVMDLMMRQIEGLAREWTGGWSQSAASGRPSRPRGKKRYPRVLRVDDGLRQDACAAY